MRIVHDFASGPPELAMEIANSSRSYDLGPKLALYRRDGVEEYVAAILEESWLMSGENAVFAFTKTRRGPNTTRSYC